METNYFEFEILKADWLKLSNYNRLHRGYRGLVNIQGEGGPLWLCVKANSDYFGKTTASRLHRGYRGLVIYRERGDHYG